ncbi:class I SAM-dependent methyltransferase [uncultured Roseobacter sp.]|uniref:class I SAM-dependent methyltransferase n=1 Tax=uncultured Roseobacter sp. TaxID=114847 RepID=UPI002612EC4B|nr:class I SAM-dependent methyltransferase [uncultured Roseobacter sp.]
MNAGNSDQAEFWTTDAGLKWVAQQAALDALFQSVLDGTLDRADLHPGDKVLDVGCGTGASTLHAAKGVGPSGFVLGADISPTMLERARDRSAGAANVDFLMADVAEHPFEQGKFDQMVSRFGVMFFADPTAAFANIHNALKHNGKVTFATWGQIPNNPWFTCAAQAAKAHLGSPPPVDPDAPGPFSMRNVDVVVRILANAGFERIAAETVDMYLTPHGTPAEVAALAISIGPAARTLSHFNGTDGDFAAVAARLETAFEPFASSQGVRIPAEINFFQAHCKAA